jgi:hypothetical protein
MHACSAAMQPLTPSCRKANKKLNAPKSKTSAKNRRQCSDRPPSNIIGHEQFINVILKSDEEKLKCSKTKSSF